MLNKINHPWILSNAFEKNTGKILGASDQTKEYLIKNIGDFKVGFLGLIEEEWIDTLGCVDKNNIRYENYIDAAKRICNTTFANAGVDFSIALTHMRNNNDLLLTNCNNINLDLILGGHDHDPL